MKIKFPNKEERDGLCEFVDMVIEEIRPKIENAIWAVMLASKGDIELDDEDDELDDACDCKRCEKAREILPEDGESPDDENDDTVRIVIKAKDSLTPEEIERLVEGVRRIADGLPTDKPTKKRKIKVE